MRRYKVRHAADVVRDFDLMDDYLIQIYQDLGDDAETAAERAAARMDEALVFMRSFAVHPHRGTGHPEIRSGVRTVTSNRFIVHFEIDETLSEAVILAVFFGGVDHQRQIRDRLQR